MIRVMSAKLHVSIEFNNAARRQAGMLRTTDVLLPNKPTLPTNHARLGRATVCASPVSASEGAAASAEVTPQI